MRSILLPLVALTLAFRLEPSAFGQAKGDKGDVGVAGPQGPQGPAGSADAWSRTGNAGTTPGVNFLGTTDNQSLEFKVNGTRGLRLQPANDGTVHVIGGSSKNVVTAALAGTIAGGGESGLPNTVTGNFGTVGGGRFNTASGLVATVAGGDDNTASGGFATVAGGVSNTAGGGFATVAGGNGNTASGVSATVAGGASNTAAGKTSFAAGLNAQANHDGTFVWSDQSDFSAHVSTGPNQFLIRATGGVGIGTTTPRAALDVLGQMQVSANGTIQSPGSKDSYRGMIETSYGDPSDRYGISQGPRGTMAIYTAGFFSGSSIQFGQATGANTFSPQMIINHAGNVGIGVTTPTSPLQVNGEAKATVFTPTSDRHAKENFAPVDAAEVLRKVAALPITEWNYKTLTGARHLGPVAQDFRAAFGLGTDDKGISTVDADGVALAAIQGLNQKMEDMKAEAQRRDVENAELKARLEKLEWLLNQQQGGGR